ncbi:MAG: ERF family protein [Gallintestinimicrobium sp.]
MEGNLQQRLLYVREQLPALAKKNHNEEVSYDFVKIDDIYKYLTPAMNRAGVLMDVVEEQATRHDESRESCFCMPASGNPVLDL